MNSPPQQLDGIFQFPELESNGHETAITIDAAYLQERPFLTNTSWYTDLGRKTTSLTLSGIDETDAEFILPLFTTLRHLSLQKMTILNNDFCGLPYEGIESLQLLDCKITRNVAKEWFESFDSLQSVKISRCSHGVQFNDKRSFIHLLHYLPDSVRALSVYDPICTSIYEISILSTSLTYLHLETPMGRSYYLIDTIVRCAPKITTLILKMSNIESWSIEILQEMKDLQHLRILNSVDCFGQSLLQSLGHLKTLDVHCYEPPEKEDQILKLNDDCLLHVFSFLQQKDWFSLSLAHSRMDRLVTTYIYQREEIVVHTGGINEDFSEQEKREIWKSLQKHATTIKVRNFIGWYFELPLSDFENLHTLSLHCCVSAAYIQTIPSGIKKLRLFSEDSVGKVHQLSDLFNRLSPSLTSLRLIGRFNPDDLSELNHLRVLEVGCWKDADLVGILQRNKDHLERLEVFFGYHSSRDASNDFPFRLCPLKRLKVLHLTGTGRNIDLIPSDFPSLEDLNVSFQYSDESTKSDLLCSISKLVQLKSLSVEGMSVKQLSALKNLESLSMFMHVHPDDIVNLLKELPKLSKLELMIRRLDLEFEAELCQLLIGEKRTLRLDGVVLP